MTLLRVAVRSTEFLEKLSDKRVQGTAIERFYLLLGPRVRGCDFHAEQYTTLIWAGEDCFFEMRSSLCILACTL